MKIDPDDVYAYGKQAGQKVNHNRLERLRRDRIKESYHGLRSSIRVKENLSRVDALKAAIAYLNDMNEKKRRILERIKEKEMLKKRLHEKIRAKGLQNRISLHDMEEESEESDHDISSDNFED